jgi:cysteine desulfurase
MKQIYFDYNATTPLAPEVAAAMRPFLDIGFGNPSSHHWAGERARTAIDHARQQVAMFVNCQPSEVVFTSGGTEANNHTLLGTYFIKQPEVTTPHFIISSVEHPAVASTCAFLERLGATVTRVPVDQFGEVNPEDVRAAIRRNTVLVSIMHANNEVGTIQPIKAISDLAHEQNILVHTDAAQTMGKFPFTLDELGVDLLTIAGHKMYAPQGIGALIIRNGVRLEPFMHGAGHENGRRAGTENVLEIVGLGAACEISDPGLTALALTNLRDHFWQSLREKLGDRVVLNGHPTRRLPNTLNVSFPARYGHDILAQCEGLAASTGSACHASSHQLSPVLHAMGVSEHVGLGAIRFSLGRNSSKEEVDAVVQTLTRVIESE